MGGHIINDCKRWDEVRTRITHHPHPDDAETLVLSRLLGANTGKDYIYMNTFTEQINKMDISILTKGGLFD